MAKIRVTPKELKSKASQLEGFNSKYKNEVNRLVQSEGSLNSMWEGDARKAFHKAFQEDKIQMDNFYNAIAQYVIKLKEIAQKYEKAEIVNTQTATNRTSKR